MYIIYILHTHTPCYIASITNARWLNHVKKTCPTIQSQGLVALQQHEPLFNMLISNIHDILILL